MLYQTALSLNCRPSELLGLENAYVAYCFDQVATYYGSWVENQLEKVGEKLTAKERSLRDARQKRLESLLHDEPEKAMKSAFADPAAMFGP